MKYSALRLMKISGCLMCLICVGCGDSSENSDSKIGGSDMALPGQDVSNAPDAGARPTPAYELPNETVSALFAQPYTYPYQTCEPVPEGVEIASEYLSEGPTGEPETLRDVRLKVRGSRIGAVAKWP